MNNNGPISASCQIKRLTLVYNRDQVVPKDILHIRAIMLFLSMSITLERQKLIYLKKPFSCLESISDRSIALCRQRTGRKGRKLTYYEIKFNTV